MYEIKNNVACVPAYAWDYPAWIVTECDDELYFYGAYDSVEKAEQICDELNAFCYNKIVISD
jgi:hypothetical protein